MTILSQESPTLALLVFWDQCQCGETVSHTNKQFTDTSRVLENSTQLWYYPEKESDFTGWRPPPPPLISVASCKLRFAAGRGLRVGSCLILRNELYVETHMLTKQEILFGRGPWAKTSKVREPRRTALPRGFMVMELVSGCLWPIILTQGLSWWPEHPSGKMVSSEKDSGRLAGHMD